MGVSEEHDQTVDADTPATGGRQTVLESNATVYKHKDPLGEQQKHSRVDERLVDPLRLVVALRPLRHLSESISARSQQSSPSATHLLLEA